MLIDWFTVGAQALNFLVLVWLMRRFLYKPIRHAIDEREKRIAAELASADKAKADAQTERQDLAKKNDDFEQQRAALLQKASEEAKAEGHRLLEAARTAAADLSAKRADKLKSDAAKLYPAIARRAQDEVFAIARKALTDLATANLEERMSDVFTRRLREVDGEEKQGLADSIAHATEPVVVRSAFDLPEAQRAEIQRAINETFSADVPLRFETSPEVVSGIELTTNGRKIAWSIADYLGALQKGVAALIAEQEKVASDPPVKVTDGAEGAPVASAA